MDTLVVITSKYPMCVKKRPMSVKSPTPKLKSSLNCENDVAIIKGNNKMHRLFLIPKGWIDFFYRNVLFLHKCTLK